MRIGERLVHEGIVTVEQLEEALRRQVTLGGRLGTNLVELGYLELDVLAGALARHHQMPAAMRSHFESASPDVQARLSPERAARFVAVPLGHLSTEPARIAIAVTDPLPELEIDQLTSLIGEPILPCVAGELRIYYYLEAVYGIPRANRFLRVRATPTGGVRALTDPDGQPVNDFAEPPPPTDSGRERRHFVKTLSEEAVDIDFDDEDDEVTEEKRALGRIALKRVDHAGRESLVGEKAPARIPRSFDETLQAIRRATGRDRIGDLVLDAFDDGLGGYFNVAAILVVREPVAIGWKGFVRGREPDVFETVAVPLTAASCLLHPYLSADAYFGPPPPPSRLDERMWAALRVPPPGTIAVLPVTVDGHIVCLIYAQSVTEVTDPTVEEQARRLAGSMERAFARLIRAAQR